MLKKLYEKQIRGLLLYQKKFNCYWEEVSFYQEELIQIVGFFKFTWPRTVTVVGKLIIKKYKTKPFLL